MTDPYIEVAARKHATVTYMDEDRKAAFIAGARFATEQFRSAVRERRGMEMNCSREWWDEFGITEIRRIVNWLLAPVEAKP